MAAKQGVKENKNGGFEKPFKKKKNGGFEKPLKEREA